MRLKESIYGWYPSARDVYLNAPRYHDNPYHLECLYRFQNSEYHSEKIPPPKATISLGLKDPPGPDARRLLAPRRAKSGLYKGPVKKSSLRQGVDWSLSAPCLLIKPAPMVKAKPIPTLSEAWATPEPTPITVTPAASYPKKVRYKDLVDERPTGPDMVGVNAENTSKPMDWPAVPHDKVLHHRRTYRGSRVKSAPPRPSTGSLGLVPRRPVQSARQCRRPHPPCQDTRSTERPHTSPVTKSIPLALVPKRETQSAGCILESTDDAGSRPDNPTPNIADLSLEDKDEDSADSEDESKLDYDEALEKYGWRAEVHGDPFGLKKTPKRLSYTVTCEDPVIPPEPPSGHMENWQTFFLNTIPTRPMTYTVHKEWMSEVIHAKRMELQQKQGVNFNFKKFAFAY